MPVASRDSKQPAPARAYGALPPLWQSLPGYVQQPFPFVRPPTGALSAASTSLYAVHRITLNFLATPTANALRFRSLDRWNVTSLDCALGALRKARRDPASSKN